MKVNHLLGWLLVAVVVGGISPIFGVIIAGISLGIWQKSRKKRRRVAEINATTDYLRLFSKLK